MHASIIEAFTTAPIESEEGIPSDHKTVCVRANMPRVPEYKIETYEYYRKDAESLEKFKGYIGQQSFSKIYEAAGSSEKVGALEEIINDGIKKCFDRKKTSKKTSEPSWVSEAIRLNIKRRRAVFRREGRSSNWWKIKLESKKIIGARRNNYNKEKKERIMSAGHNQFFKCVNAFLGEGQSTS